MNERWKDYTEKLNNVDRRIEFREGIGEVEYEKEPNAMMAEVEWALGSIH